MGAGILGGEIDFGFAPDFFDRGGNTKLVSSSHVLTLMGNVIIGAPIGGQRGPGLRPYVVLTTRSEPGRGTASSADLQESGVGACSVYDPERSPVPAASTILALSHSH